MLFMGLLVGLNACGGGSSDNGPDDIVKPPEVGFVVSDFEKQVYTTKEFESFVSSSALFFKADRTGIKYLNDKGDKADKGYIPAATLPFTWGIKDKKLEVTFNGGGGVAIYTLKSKEGNKFNTRRDGKNLTLYKAKKLNLADLNNKILKYKNAFYYDEASKKSLKCQSRTLKVTGNSAEVKEVCGPVATPTRPMTVSIENSIDNTITFTEGESTVIMLLTDGDLKSGNVTQVYSTKGVLDYVELEAIEAVTTEAF